MSSPTGPPLGFLGCAVAGPAPSATASRVTSETAETLFMGGILPCGRPAHSEMARRSAGHEAGEAARMFVRTRAPCQDMCEAPHTGVHALDIAGVPTMMAPPIELA